MGHILALSSLKNIDFQNQFSCKYDIIETKKKNIENIRKKIKEFDEVIISSDPDREGEGIAWAICHLFSLNVQTTKRVTFNEITETAIVNAMKCPKTIDMQLVHAQQARQILDLIVGYKITPTLWKHITKHASNSLSAGRCQTPALRLIYENQKEIDGSSQKKTYHTTGYFTNLNIPCLLNKEFESEKELIAFLNGTTHFSHQYSFTSPKKTYKTPPEPFTTSRIQQVASNELHLSPKETMTLCQNLYEAGYITYMRTDSKTYSHDFIQTIQDYILRNYPDGEKYINSSLMDTSLRGTSLERNDTNTKKKKTEFHEQNAHEAIRPTDISLCELSDKINSKERKLYKLIWENTMESCMATAIFNAIKISITAFNGAIFTYTSEQVVFPGWLEVRKKYSSETKEFAYLQKLNNNSIIPCKKIISKITVNGCIQHYTEARLVQLLEEKGIGRPSTFSSLVEKIQERGYVKKQDIKGKTIVCKDYEWMDGNIIEKETKREIGNEKNKLVIQALGVIVMEFLSNHFSSLFDYEYTKNMEDDLDKISKGNKIWHELCLECNNQVDHLVETLNKKEETKVEFQIDDSNSYIIGKYGPVIKHVETKDGKKETTFTPVKKEVQLDQIQKGELELEDIIDTNVKKKQYILGKYEEKEVVLKKGKYGLYIAWSDKNIPLKELGNRPIENVTFDEIQKYLEGDNGYVRPITPDLSIRKSAKGYYLFYKTSKMKKPEFYDINPFCKETNADYKTCDVSLLKKWIKEKYEVV
jgi:DNA topoisomerase-1